MQENPFQPDERLPEEPPEPKGSALQQLKERLWHSHVLTGDVANVPYAYLDNKPRRASYQIKFVTRSTISVQITVYGPFGEEIEEYRLNSETGECLQSHTHEPEYLYARVIAVIYHAIGLPPSYWEPPAS